MSASQRRKGHGWEREIAARWRDSGLYPDARRGLSQARGGGAEECDVEGLPYHVEAKCGARPDLWRALEQAERDSDGRAALVVAKRDRRGACVVVRLETWEELVRELHAARAQAAAAREAAVLVARSCASPYPAVEVET